MGKQIIISESEKKDILSKYGVISEQEKTMTEQSLVSSYSDSECYREYPNIDIEGLKRFLSSTPDTIKKLNINNIQYSTIDLAILSKIICMLNQTLYSVYNNKWQKDIDKKLYVDISNLIQSKCSGLLTFKEGIEKFKDRYTNFKKLIDTVYK